jgi:hypothetical protein
MWLNGGDKSPLFRSCKDKTNLFGVKPKGAPSTHRGNVRRTRFFWLNNERELRAISPRRRKHRSLRMATSMRWFHATLMGLNRSPTMYISFIITCKKNYISLSLLPAKKLYISFISENRVKIIATQRLLYSKKKTTFALEDGQI